MSKISILCISPDNHGVGNFRFIEPHLEIQKQFGDDFYVDINMAPDWDDEKYLEKFQIIFGSYFMLDNERAKVILPKLRAKGIKIIIDIDDFWEIPPNNPMHQLAINTNHTGKVLEYLTLVDHIVTTTEHLAKEIKKYNKNVTIFRNAVDPTSKKYKIKEEHSDLVRLGWLGGSTHYHDLMLLKPMFSSLAEKYKDKVQSVFCGFDISGIVKNTDQHGNVQDRPIKPEETPSYHYEKIFTADFKNIDPEYLRWLRTYKKEDYKDFKTVPYRRVWTKPFSSYSLNYNLFDISLIPLENNRFNTFKSELKIIEAGMFKKPAIISDVLPYQSDIKHGVNGLLVKEGSKKNWSYYIKDLIDNQELRTELGEQLYETVKDKYNLKNVSKDRGEWYKTLIK